ncbi:MAG: hypothetical protein COU47_02290 [Candidatus Niyogibacteria bacterium CG10_big_fil_rev_8_21_14_0_10_46_36]|uniref:Uncharacterized protein n=1 Tax=Candidatus Niyogibacteria bacterium CG10_big_fil_rev_8_21_14_0_10_46_36 TaxID=1974726 RepID=A0A2H0TDE0_9BACT|nr:MAG: hypothetical protein COU47_02290 [Candidatus Niyogibacteria bacterium CG10_big_fil_rev_8_21_14_0_10_46_36]
MKKLIIAFIIILLLILGFFAYRTLFSTPPVDIPNPPDGDIDTLFPISPATPTPPLPTGDKITITTHKGTVTTNNFFKIARDIGSDVYSLAETTSYYITYYRPDNSFQIAIGSRPAQASRAQAESALVNLLGITEQEACGLLINLAVPFDVDPALAGHNYNLSFCPDGISF